MFIVSQFPVYEYQRSLVLSGKNGSVLTMLGQDSLATLSSPLTLSLTGTGNDFFLHWSANCAGRAGGEPLQFGFRAGTHSHEQSRADLCRAIHSTQQV